MSLSVLLSPLQSLLSTFVLERHYRDEKISRWLQSTRYFLKQKNIWNKVAIYMQISPSITIVPGF